MPSLLEMLGYLLQGGQAPAPHAMGTLEIPQQFPTAIQPVGGGIRGVPSAAQEALQAPDIDPIDIATGTAAFGGPAFNTLSALALGAGSHYLDQPASVMARGGMPTQGIGDTGVSIGIGGPTSYMPFGLAPEPVPGETKTLFGKDVLGFPKDPTSTRMLNPIEDPKLPLPEYMYHGLGVGSWDARMPSREALSQQKETLQSILPVRGAPAPFEYGGLEKGWFSDKPLPGYGPVYLAVKTEDLPQHGSWGNPHAKNFPGSGESQFYTYRPWDFDPSQPIQSLQTAVERGGAGPVPPSKIMLADRTGKIIAPIESEEAQTYLKNMGKKLTGILYPTKGTANLSIPEFMKPLRPSEFSLSEFHDILKMLEAAPKP